MKRSRLQKRALSLKDGIPGRPARKAADMIRTGRVLRSQAEGADSSRHSRFL